MNEKVLYFSLSQERKKSFYSFIKNTSICYQPKFSFDLVGEKESFKDPRDLLSLIEHERKKDSLHVIIDYISCCGSGKEINYSTVIRNIIMCFPEVQFLFDETFVNRAKTKESHFGFLNFLFWSTGKEGFFQEDHAIGKPDVFSLVLMEFHQFDLVDFSDEAIKKQFILLLTGRNNMYDASNLRYAIKMQKFSDLSVLDNYSNLDYSRCFHPAVVVEEEYHQAQFNSYCLYANGYRVFPIVSSSELIWINTTLEIRINHSVALFLDKELHLFQRLAERHKVSLQDLTMFRDEMAKERDNAIRVFGDKTEQLEARLSKELLSISSMIERWDGKQKKKKQDVIKSFMAQLSQKIEDVVLLIRDYDLQFKDEGAVNSRVKTGKDINRNEVDYIRGAKKNEKAFELIEDDGDPKNANPYWKSFYKGASYFVSKGDSNITVDRDFPVSMSVANKPKLELRGIKKPLEGIYAWAHQIPSVRRRYMESRDNSVFDTGRQGEGGHSCPLDIYGIVRPMVRRAGVYYNREHRYRLAALVAREALGILNGFHKSLMNKAYYTLSVAENAMAMCLLGGDEAMLVKDIKLRLKQIVQEDVKRMISDRNDRFNLLYNIYNDCHLFCQEKEYFNAADEALSVMVHEREGLDIAVFFRWIFALCKSIYSRIIKLLIAVKRFFAIVLNLFSKFPWFINMKK